MLQRSAPSKFKERFRDSGIYFSIGDGKAKIFCKTCSTIVMLVVQLMIILLDKQTNRQTHKQTYDALSRQIDRCMEEGRVEKLLFSGIFPGHGWIDLSSPCSPGEESLVFLGFYNIPFVSHFSRSNCENTRRVREMRKMRRIEPMFRGRSPISELESWCNPSCLASYP